MKETYIWGELKPDNKIDLWDQDGNYIWGELRQRLNEIEIRECLDQVAKLKGNVEIDTDIPDQPEAFAQAIQRERKNWSDIM